MMTRLLKELPTKQYIDEILDKRISEVHNDLRDRIKVVQDCIIGFQQQWQLGVPTIVKKKLDKHEERMTHLENFAGIIPELSSWLKNRRLRSSSKKSSPSSMCR